MDVILLRHGETIHNIQGKYSSDECPLSEEGVLQIERAADKIDKMIIDKIWVSPLYRTRETLEIINKYHKIPYEIRDEVSEIDAGLLKGKTFNEGMTLYPEEIEDYLFDYVNNPLPKGESIQEAFERARRVVKELKKESGNILIITHGGFISLLLAYLLGDVKNYHRFDIDNGSFTLIKMDDFPRIRYINRI